MDVSYDMREYLAQWELWENYTTKIFKSRFLEDYDAMDREETIAQEKRQPIEFKQSLNFVFNFWLLTLPCPVSSLMHRLSSLPMLKTIAIDSNLSISFKLL